MTFTPLCGFFCEEVMGFYRFGCSSAHRASEVVRETDVMVNEGDPESCAFRFGLIYTTAVVFLSDIHIYSILPRNTLDIRVYLG